MKLTPPADFSRLFASKPKQNRKPVSPRLGIASLAISLLASLLSTSQGAPPPPPYYWDTNGSTAGTGGTGTWQSGAGNWNLSDVGTGTDTNWTDATSTTVGTRAIFAGTAGTVTVSGSVATAAPSDSGSDFYSGLLFQTDGYTLSGGAITIFGGGASHVIEANTSTGGKDITLGNAITIDGGANTAGSANYYIANSTNSNLILNGDIQVDNVTANVKAVNFNQANAAGALTINGALSIPNPGTATLRLRFGNAEGVSGGSYYVNGSNTGITSDVQITRGAIYLGNANAFGTATVTLGNTSTATGDTARLLTNAAFTVANGIILTTLTNSATVDIGGNSAAQSEFSGAVTLGNIGVNLTAASGGRVDFSGAISNSSTFTGGITKTGPGIVRLTRPAGNSYKGNTLVAEGTLLLMNTSAGATGATAGSTVTVSGGATLGGTGISTRPVTASAANSILSPGDMSLAGVSSIGTLNLTGGLTASSGVKFAIDLDGASNDKVNFGSGALTLGGNVTFAFSNLGSVATGTPYSLFTGTGAWSGTPAFAFTAPAGFALDSTYGTSGYLWDAANHSMTVEFAAVPEPQSFALAAGGLAMLACLSRKRRK